MNKSHEIYLVSKNIQLISESPFAEFCTFFNEFIPNKVADKIVECSDKIKINNSKYTPKDLIDKLDKSFVKDIRNLIEKV